MSNPGSLSFDDLIPGQQAPATAPKASAGGISFDDLIPGNAAQGDLGLHGVVRPDGAMNFDRPIEDVRADIARLPENQRQHALNAWAENYVAKEREGGGIGQRIGDTLNRVGRGLPGIGAWADEINAKVSDWTGQAPYDEALAYQRARNKAIDATPTQHLGTLPLIGDVSAGGVEKAIGTVGGAFAMPGLNVVRSAGVIPGAINAAVTGTAIGAAEGAGNAEDGNRLGPAMREGLTTGAIAAPLGAVVGRMIGRGTPPATDEVARAAQRLDVQVPRAAAYSGDGMVDSAVRNLGGKMASVPVLGAPLQTAKAGAREGMDTAARRIADDYATSATPYSAGKTASEGIQKWMKEDSRDALNRMYQKVESKLNPNALSPIPNTMQAANRLTAADREAASKVNAQAVQLVEEAVTRPQGMSAKGIMDLRTAIGAMIDDKLLPNAGTTKPALKQLYAALSVDLEGAIRAAGGRSGVIAWNRANKTAKAVAEQREELAKIIGTKGELQPEAVIDRLVTYAGSKSSADIEKLLRARSVIGKDAWDEVSAAAIHRLGRDQSNNFNPAAFAKNYQALSQSGRDALFSSTGKQNLREDLDALLTLSKGHRTLAASENHSGTGGVVAILSAVTGAMTAPALTAAGAIGTSMAAAALAKPVRVRQISAFAKAWASALDSKAGQGTMRLALTQLSRGLSEDTGMDANEIASRILGALPR